MAARKKRKSSPAKRKTVRKSAARKSAARKKRKSSDPLQLDTRPGIQAVSELKLSLSACLKAKGTVVVDGSAVETIDTAALQLLTAFMNRLRNQSRSVEWLNPSEALLELAHLAGLDVHLDITPGSSEAGASTNDEAGDGLCPVF